MKAGDVDRFEVNEALPAIALVVRDGLKIDPARFNADGGAIAHGHPIGATGAILVTKVAQALKRTGGRKAVVSLCIRGGQGIALCLARADRRQRQAQLEQAGLVLRSSVGAAPDRRLS